MRFDKRALAAIGAFIELYVTQALLPLLVHEFAASPAAVSRTVIAAVVLVAVLAISFWDKDQRPPETLRTAPET